MLKTFIKIIVNQNFDKHIKQNNCEIKNRYIEYNNHEKNHIKEICLSKLKKTW